MEKKRILIELADSIVKTLTRQMKLLIPKSYQQTLGKNFLCDILLVAAANTSLKMYTQ